MLLDNRFNTYLVFNFHRFKRNSNLKLLYRDSPLHEIEKVMGVKFLSLFKPNKHAEHYHIREPNDKFFLFEIEDENYNYVGETLVSFETID